MEIVGNVCQSFRISLWRNFQSLQRLPLSSLFHRPVGNPCPPAICVRGWGGNLLQGGQNNRRCSKITALSSKETKPNKAKAKILQSARRITKKPHEHRQSCALNGTLPHFFGPPSRRQEELQPKYQETKSKDPFFCHELKIVAEVNYAR